MKSNLTYLAAAAALALTTACGNSNNAVGENRPDAAAVNRAAQVTNSSDNKEADASATRDAAGTSGQTAGQAMDRSTDRVGEGASNASMTARIQAKFIADDLVKTRRIDVDSKDGVVTLSGSVMSKAESDKAEQLARQTDDVKRVVNNLKVEARH